MTTQRQGVAAITVLVVLAVLAIVLSVVTLQMVSQRRFLHQRERQLQADNLARAGIEFAAARLLASGAAFTDERTDWQPDGRVRIQVTKSKGETFTVTVEATVAGENELPVRRDLTREFHRIDKAGVVRLELIRTPAQ
ncbi:MAG: hypothetical protein EXS16_17830 [Gemmataceae bacterium]|nr:hypothetical protein [Gemmataceae bacterium]